LSETAEQVRSLGLSLFKVTDRNPIQDLERLTPYVPDLVKKQSVTTQSLEKIENGAF